jgi:hypothetical protein
MRALPFAAAAALLALACLLSLAAPQAAQAADAVSINEGAAVTNNPTVSVSIPSPTGAQSLIRLSNDGKSWSAARPWAASVSWSLTDAATGGSGIDGKKAVFVQWDDGTGSWRTAGSDTIELDRTPPALGCVWLELKDPQYPWVVLGSYGCGWGNHTPGEFYEFSIDDGKSWWPRFGVEGDGSPPDRFVHLDLRTKVWGGTYKAGNRSVCLRAYDTAGNYSQPQCQTFFIDPSTSSKPQVTWEFPKPAVTGQLFTLRPKFPSNYVITPDTVCFYFLRWGDEYLTRAEKNEHYGAVQFERKAKQGGCGEWTFSLPYTAGLTYNFQFSVKERFGYCTCESWDIVTTFKAAQGTTQRGIPQSTIPLLYLLPDKQLTAVGEPITYTLYGSEGVTPPKAGWFWTYPVSGANDGFSQYGGRTFTFKPNQEGPWHTGWTGELFGMPIRAEFDPPADKRPPTVSAPVAVPAAGKSLSSTVPVTLSWTAVDPKLKTGDPGSGLARVRLQVSRNGGTWKTVTLPSAKATSVTLNLNASGSYRYRVRAWDRAGNASAWAYGPTFKPRLVQETSSSVTRTGSWTKHTNTNLSGGSAFTSVASGATMTYTFYGRGVGWVATVGPGRGFAQVRVDGTLVQTIDLSAPSAADRRIVFGRSWNRRGDHKLSIRVLGTFSRPEVSVDAFIVLK